MLAHPNRRLRGPVLKTARPGLVSVGKLGGSVSPPTRLLRDGPDQLGATRGPADDPSFTNERPDYMLLSDNGGAVAAFEWFERE